jgi:hypothetical protein
MSVVAIAHNTMMSANQKLGEVRFNMMLLGTSAAT